VNGGPSVPVMVDTGSAGLFVPITAIGLQHLGLPSGFGIVSYGNSQLSQTSLYATFNTTVNFGNGLVTAPTSVNVPVFTIMRETLTLVNPITIPLPAPFPTIVISELPLVLAFPNVPPFTSLISPPSYAGILGIGPSATGPSPHPVTTALPGHLNEGVLINVPQGVLQFGPNPLDTRVSVPGSPVAILNLQINDGPLQRVAALIDSGGGYGTIPSYLVGNNTVPLTISNLYSVGDTVSPGTVVSVYTSDGQTLLYTYTASAGASPTVVSGNIFNTGLVPFLQQPVYIGYGPNSGSPTVTSGGVTLFRGNVGITDFSIP